MHAEPGVANADIFPGRAGSGQEWSRSEMFSSGGTLAGNRWCSPPGPCGGRLLRGLLPGVWGGWRGTRGKSRRQCGTLVTRGSTTSFPGLKEKALKMSGPPRGPAQGLRPGAEGLGQPAETQRAHRAGGECAPGFPPLPLPSPVSYGPCPT